MSNASLALNALVAQRLQALKAKQATERKIENEGKDTTSIEVPAAIQKLITGSDYWIKAKTNRYKKLMREGHLNDLLELANLAPQMATKADPSHWFARVCSVKYWEKRTLDFLKKRHAVLKKAEEVAARIGTEMAERMQQFVFKQIWLKRSVERHVATAQELKHDKPNQNSAKLFAWLCQQEGKATA